MAFPQPDRVTLIKQDGKIISDIPALVQSELIFINDGKMLIEVKDIIQRTLPSGSIEKYIVIDPCYQSFPIALAHYQVKVRKDSPFPTEKSTDRTTIYQLGHNSRVNVNSTDISHNSVTNLELMKFEEIKKEITDQIFDNEEKTECLQSLDDLKNSVGKISYRESYKQFIETIANHMTIITPFIPFLTNFL